MVWASTKFIYQGAPHGGLHLVDCHKVTATPESQLPSSVSDGEMSILWLWKLQRKRVHPMACVGWIRPPLRLLELLHAHTHRRRDANQYIFLNQCKNEWRYSPTTLPALFLKNGVWSQRVCTPVPLGWWLLYVLLYGFSLSHHRGATLFVFFFYSLAHSCLFSQGNR